MIYFVWNPDTNHVKIGSSVNPASRLRELQSRIPTQLAIIAIVRDCNYAEQFAAHHINSNWYKLEGSLAAYVAGNLIPMKYASNFDPNVKPLQHNRDKQCCKRGHKLLPGNVYLYKGRRYCLYCRRDEQAKRAMVASK